MECVSTELADLYGGSGAEFSNCGMYRYMLWRTWIPGKPAVMFIGLNPSTANQIDDDPTIRRVKRFANDWGYGTVYMMNCFAYVSSDPKRLEYHLELFGYYDDLNDEWLTNT